MTVLSKLLYEIMPKSMAGWAFCVLPIAAVAIIVMYPKAVIKAFMPVDVDSLSLEDSKGTAGGEEAKKKKRRAFKTKTINKGELKSLDINTEDKPAEQEDEEESLLNLASIQGKLAATAAVAPKPQKTINFTPSNKQAAESPVFNVLTLNDADESKWSRVPTKQEEAITSLKNRVATLTRQLEDSERDVKDLRVKLEKEHAHGIEIEQELKERTRSYQIRWVEMEGEISTLKNSKTELVNKLNETLGAQGQTLNQRDTLIISLKERIQELEVVSGSVPALKKLLNSHEEAEKELKGQIIHLEAELARSVESSLEDQLKLNREKETAEEKVKELKGTLENLQRTKEKAAEEISALQKQLENSVASVKSTSEEKESLTQSLESKKEEIQALKNKLEASVASVAIVKEENQKQTELIRQKEEEAKKISTELEMIKKENESLSSEQSELREKSTDLTAETKEENVKLQEEISKYHEELEKLANMKDALEAAQKERLELADQLEQAEKLTKQYKLDQERAEKKLGIMQSVTDMKYAAYNAEVAELKVERDRLMSELAGFARSTEIVDRLVTESSK